MDISKIDRPTFLKELARYALAAAFACAAALIAWFINPRIGESTASLFFAAVVLSAWLGGLGPGILATVLAGYFSGDYRLNPIGTPGYGWDDILREGVFLVVSLLISSLLNRRQRAEREMYRAFAELEARIEERTRELRESEERFRLLVEGVADYAIVMLDSSGKVASWNPGARRIFGFGADEALGGNASAFYPPEDIARGKPQADLLEAAQQGRREDDGWRMRGDSSRFFANVITTALRDEQGKLRGFAQVTRDVTELRSLEKELLEISEREQMRIGHDLHDGVGQELTGVAFLAENLRERLARQQAPEEAEAARIAALVNRALEQARKLARGFSPVELGPQGLETALRDMAAKVTTTMQRNCSMTCQGPLNIADDAVALHLFRIAQEAVNNSVRHSKANQIRIELTTMEGVTTLAVHDDGVGMPPRDDRGKGMGVSVMRYRSRMIGGTLEIRSSAEGTSVICVCPNQQGHERSTNHRQETAPARR